LASDSSTFSLSLSVSLRIFLWIPPCTHNINTQYNTQQIFFYDDRSYDTFIMPPQLSNLVRAATQVNYLSGNYSIYVGYITPQMLYHIAEIVRPADHYYNLVEWCRLLANSCDRMRIKVVDIDTKLEVFKEESAPAVIVQDTTWKLE
jgi:hypothetical protein